MGKRVLGVLGGRDLDPTMSKIWAESAHILLAADSGADSILEHGFRPDAIIGDMDSISADALGLGVDMIKDDDQNRTDCEKLLSHAVTLGHRSITLLGVEGDRVDHFFATLHACVASPIDVRLAIRDGLGRILGPGCYRLPAQMGRRFSVLPLVPSRGISLSGVRWPVTTMDMSLGTQISISNEATGAFVDLEFESGHILVAQEFGHRDLPIWPDQDGLAILES